jgi:hypothetical protein
VDILAEGSGVVAQDGREARLSGGDVTLVDLTRPAYWRMSPVRIVAVVFPRSLLPLRPPELARLTAVRIPGNRGAGALVSSLAGQLVSRVVSVFTSGRGDAIMGCDAVYLCGADR